MEKPLVIDYSDRMSTLSVWWKGIFLAPPWGYILLPFLGATLILIQLNNLELVGYITTMLLFLVYFSKELLERKIRIEKGQLYHGFSAHDLSSLLSVGTAYTRKQALPMEMVLTFGSGKHLKLKLNRLKFKDYESFLRLIADKYPHCKIDPVLWTLVRCKSTARQILVDDSERLIIQYDSHKKLKHFIDTFIETAQPWMRIGPILAVAFCFPFWVGISYQACLWGNLGSQRAYAYGMMNDIVALASQTDGKLIEFAHWAGTGLAKASDNSLLLAFLLSVTFGMMFYHVKLLLKPTAIVIDQDGIKIKMTTGNYAPTLKEIHWREIKQVSLVKDERASSTRLLIRFQCTNGSNCDLDLSAVMPADRPRLMKVIDRLAPNCHVDSDLAEIMMPKQEKSYTEVWLQSLSGKSETSSVKPLASGQALQEGRYIVEKRLGIGGQGTAYLCSDTVSGVPVVLKETVIPIFADRTIKDQSLKRFELEARMLQKIDSDQVVKMRDFFFEEHRGYLVLDYVEGKNLRQIISENGPMNEEQVCSLALHMCEIIAHLHDRSIIHRDFTPDNLMLGPAGNVKLIDFNVAQTMQVGATGTVAGKLSYLPPEQFRGKATLQSDIYAFGATLFFLLTGRDPEAISCASPRAANSSVSEELDHLIKECTELKLERRIGKIQEVEQLLKEITGPRLLSAHATNENSEPDNFVFSLRQRELDQKEA